MYTLIHKKHPYIHVALFTISFFTLQVLEETHKNDCTLLLDTTFSYFITSLVTRQIIDFVNYAAEDREFGELIFLAGSIISGGTYLLFEQNHISKAICESLEINNSNYLSA